MNDDEARNKLEQWVLGLSPVVQKKLEAVLSAVIPAGEVRGANPVGLCMVSLDGIAFDTVGLSKENAVELLEALKWKGGADEFEIEGNKICLTTEAIETLKFVQEIVAEDKKEKIQGNPHLFYLSHRKGLYRVFKEKEECYPIHRAEQRYAILNNLTKTYQNTATLAALLKTTPDKLRAQIAGMRELIEKHFKGIRGTDFIEGEQTRGYRIGEKITLKRG